MSHHVQHALPQFFKINTPFEPQFLLKILFYSRAPLAHTHNPGYSRGRDLEKLALGK
jgi:hypothetical protein